MSYLTVSHCSTEHQEWLHSLDFYDSELDILEKWLGEIVKKNNKVEVLKGIEHFQNQFIIQRNNIDILSHNINEHIHKNTLNEMSSSLHTEKVLAMEHEQLEDEFKMFEKVVNELRKEYNLYLSKWM